MNARCRPEDAGAEDSSLFTGSRGWGPGPNLLDPDHTRTVVPTTTETITVDAAQGDAFDYVADFSHLAEWDPTFVLSERVDDGPLGVGSTFDCRMVVLDVQVPMALEIVEYERPSRVVLQGTGDGFTTREEITVAPTAAGGSELTCTSEFDSDRPDWVDAMGAPVFTVVGKAAVHGLHRHLEQDA